MRLLHGFSQPRLANLLPSSRWAQAGSPNRLQVSFTSILDKYTVTELCKRVHEAAPEGFSFRWSSRAENLAETWAAWQREKLVMTTGNISIWHFIAGDLSLTWFSQIANTSEFPHQMEILCLIVTQRRCRLTILSIHHSLAGHGVVPFFSALLSSEPIQRACSASSISTNIWSFVLSCFAARQWPIT